MTVTSLVQFKISALAVQKGVRELGSVALFEALYRLHPVLLAIIYTWSAEWLP